ncbi:MAG: type II toxin-antitoxin system RelE/ParE family toxin [Saprospiraceae bacterium]|uniref:Type II toxin-antitoxin system RelE/ParE family toxin n=1 Tax=Candidatus Opimibacter skivensis TaxID=2982028 RepID=A0A9D7XMY9_9BACT|nr:type II toxin-antitoxin system RelE/ParE family toxin [Candidatus Opimibacter skivensis]
MIKSFGDHEAEKIWHGNRSGKLPTSIQQIARRKLRMLNNAQDLNDIRVPPANHLEKLSGKLIGFHSIRINQQWRIIFNWKDGHSNNVKILDYH